MDYNLETIFVRFQESGESNLRDWLSNDGSRPVNSKLFNALESIKDIRSKAEKSDSVAELERLNDNLDRITNPGGKFKNFSSLQGTTEDEIEDNIVRVRRERSGELREQFLESDESIVSKTQLAERRNLSSIQRFYDLSDEELSRVENVLERETGRDW